MINPVEEPRRFGERQKGGGPDDRATKEEEGDPRSMDNKERKEITGITTLKSIEGPDSGSTETSTEQVCTFNKGMCNKHKTRPGSKVISLINFEPFMGLKMD